MTDPTAPAAPGAPPPAITSSNPAPKIKRMGFRTALTVRAPFLPVEDHPHGWLTKVQPHSLLTGKDK